MTAPLLLCQDALIGDLLEAHSGIGNNSGSLHREEQARIVEVQGFPHVEGADKESFSDLVVKIHKLQPLLDGPAGFLSTPESNEEERGPTSCTDRAPAC